MSDSLLNKNGDIHIRVSPILKERAQKLADSQERKLTWVVVKALEQYLGDNVVTKGKQK